MANYTGTLEQAGDGSWTAAIIGKHTVLGTGSTRDEALRDLQDGVRGVTEHLRHTGETMNASSIELALSGLLGPVMVMV
jgi:predicted RNase H-like HicB family nuclease